MEREKLSESMDELCVTNMGTYEANSEEIDKILSHMEMKDNFAFFDQMDLVEL